MPSEEGNLSNDVLFTVSSECIHSFLYLVVVWFSPVHVPEQKRLQANVVVNSNLILKEPVVRSGT